MSAWVVFQNFLEVGAAGREYDFVPLQLLVIRKIVERTRQDTTVHDKQLYNTTSTVHIILSNYLNGFSIAGQSDIHKGLITLQIFKGRDNVGMKPYKWKIDKI